MSFFQPSIFEDWMSDCIKVPDSKLGTFFVLFYTIYLSLINKFLAEQFLLNIL